MLKSAIKIAVLAVVVIYVFKLAVDLGVFTHHHKHHPGKCKKLNNKQFGFEDFEVTSKGVAFITSGVHFEAMGPGILTFYNKFKVKGKMFTFDFNQPDKGVSELKIVGGDKNNFDVDTFRPHGIGLLEDKTSGRHLLYVVNHPHGQPDTVEKFRFQPKSNDLVHEKSFSSEKFLLTNDIAVVKEDVFYVSNYLYYNNAWGAKLEFLLKLKWASVLFYDGKDFSYAIQGLHSPNGVLLSADGRFLYVNVPHLKTLHVYSRDQTDNSLTLTQDIDLHTSADNLHFSQSGDAILAGCHPIGIKTLSYSKDPEHVKAPSQVLHIPLSQGRVVPEDITELLYDHGDLISGSSIAAIHNELLLVGAVSDNLVLCDTKGLTQG